MKIVFFGSSHGLPEPHRKCSSILLEVGERRYFIDMGTQSIEGLITRRIPVDSVKGIFITHMHGDHTDGLISFLDLCSWYYKTAQPIIYLPDKVHDSVAAIHAWYQCTEGSKMRDFDFRPVNQGLMYEDEAIRITAFRTYHTGRSFAFLVEAEGKRVLFTGDLKNPQVDFPTSVLEKPLDLAVCECAHFHATDYLPIFENCENLKKICFTHYSDPHLPSIIEVRNKLSDKPVLMATDDMEITL